MQDISVPWGMLTILGVVVLGVVIAFALFQNRKVTRREFQRGEEATRRLYDEKDDTPSAPNPPSRG